MLAARQRIAHGIFIRLIYAWRWRVSSAFACISRNDESGAHISANICWENVLRCVRFLSSPFVGVMLPPGPLYRLLLLLLHFGVVFFSLRQTYLSFGRIVFVDSSCLTFDVCEVQCEYPMILRNAFFHKFFR